MSQQAFFFDGTRCSGCKTCMFACKDAYDLDVGTAYRRVLEYTGGDTVRNGDGTFGSTCFSYNVSVACNHCDDPVCVRVCPTEPCTKTSRPGWSASTTGTASAADTVICRARIALRASIA